MWRLVLKPSYSGYLKVEFQRLGSKKPLKIKPLRCLEFGTWKQKLCKCFPYGQLNMSFDYTHVYWNLKLSTSDTWQFSVSPKNYIAYQTVGFNLSPHQQWLIAVRSPNGCSGMMGKELMTTFQLTLDRFLPSIKWAAGHRVAPSSRAQPRCWKEAGAAHGGPIKQTDIPSSQHCQLPTLLKHGAHFFGGRMKKSL